MAKTTIIELEKKLCEEVFPLVKEHDKILVRGNGEPSLQEKLRGIETYIKEDKENRKYYSRLFITMAVTNLTTLALSLLVWFIKIGPLLEKLRIAEVVLK